MTDYSSLYRYWKTSTPQQKEMSNKIRTELFLDINSLYFRNLESNERFITDLKYVMFSYITAIDKQKKKEEIIQEEDDNEESDVWGA